MPQSGTVVAGIGLTALEGLITDMLKLEPTDFASLVETRVMLEVNAAKLAASRRSSEDILMMQNALRAHEEKVQKGVTAVEEDFLLHLQIAEASKNRALKSLMLIIIPDIIKSFNDLKVCNEVDPKRTVKEHQQIIDHIINKDEYAAEEAMKRHLNDVTEFSQNYFPDMSKTL